MIRRKQLKRSEREEIYNMFDGHCAYCGSKIAYTDMQVDHAKPFYNGGKDIISNMMPACRSCNHYKSTLTIDKFRESLMKMPQVLKRDNVTYKIASRFGIVTESHDPVVFYFERMTQRHVATKVKTGAGEEVSESHLFSPVKPPGEGELARQGKSFQ